MPSIVNSHSQHTILSSIHPMSRHPNAGDATSSEHNNLLHLAHHFDSGVVDDYEDVEENRILLYGIE